MAAPPPALFVQEYLGAAENRVNLALFALLNVDSFREWFLKRLGLPGDATVYPPQNVKGSRPDFVVVAADGGVLGWIEVELGPPDQPQLGAYREKFDEPVLCIAGTAAGDLELDAVASAVLARRPSMGRQQQVSADVLVALVNRLAGTTEVWNYAEPREGLRREPLIAALAERSCVKELVGGCVLARSSAEAQGRQGPVVAGILIPTGNTMTEPDALNQGRESFRRQAWGGCLRAAVGRGEPNAA